MGASDMRIDPRIMTACAAAGYAWKPRGQGMGPCLYFACSADIASDHELGREPFGMSVGLGGLHTPGVKTDAVEAAAALSVSRLFGELTDEFGEGLLQRAAVWMTLRESKASFAIEGEADRVGRVQRFADVMARRTGQGEVPLNDVSLAALQQEILGDRTTITHFGIRQSPVFVGETVRHQEVVHYVAPAADEVGAMLEGLRVFLDRTEGQAAVMRSAVAAFGFVYIHPLADGNGRVHRFLVNDILLAKEVPILAKPGIWAEIVDAVSQALAEERTDMAVIDRYRSSKLVGR